MFAVINKTKSMMNAKNRLMFLDIDKPFSVTAENEPATCSIAFETKKIEIAIAALRLIA